VFGVLFNGVLTCKFVSVLHPQIPSHIILVLEQIEVSVPEIFVLKNLFISMET
jgi:hypothetical protein